MDDANQEISSLKATIDSLNSDKVKTDNEITRLKTEVESLQNENSSLKDENSSMKTNIGTLETALDIANDQLNSYKEAEEQAKKEKEVQESDVTVVLTDKGKLPKDIDKWRFSSYVTVVFEVTNNTPKDIQGVQGIATFMDIFGEDIVSMRCDFTGKTISAGKAIKVDSLTYEVNEFIDKDVKLYNTDFKDLKFSYKVTGGCGRFFRHPHLSSFCILEG